MFKETTDILHDVRVILGENEVIQPAIDMGDMEAVERDILTGSMIGRAIDRINMVAPVMMIAEECTKTDVIDVQSTSECAKVSLNANVIRVASVKLDGWSRSVEHMLSENDDEYLALKSEFEGIRANKERPAAAIAISASGGRVLEAYPNSGTGKALLVTKAKESRQTLLGTSKEGYSISEPVYDAVLYMIASLYNGSIGESARMQMYEQKALEMIGITRYNSNAGER